MMVMHTAMRVPITKKVMQQIWKSKWKSNLKLMRVPLFPSRKEVSAEDTARRYGYEVANINNKRVEIANFYQDGRLVAQHLRGPNKQFHWNGNSRGVTLGVSTYGNPEVRNFYITEGEYDCMTVNQLLGGKWCAVSLPNGAAGAVRAIKDNLEFVSSFDNVILVFDQDEAGKAAAVNVAELLPPGKAKIAVLPYKDANECLVKGAGQEVVNAVWQAAEYSPDEIVHVSKDSRRIKILLNLKCILSPSTV